MVGLTADVAVAIGAGTDVAVEAGDVVLVRSAMPYTGTQMDRRLLVVALACVVIGGPLASDVCEAFCSEHAGHSIDSTVRSSHHDHSGEAANPPSHHHQSDAARAPGAPSARLMALPHGCGHVEAILSESRELTRVPIATAVVAVARLTPLLVHVVPTSQMDSRPSSHAIRSTSPLRI